MANDFWIFTKVAKLGKSGPLPLSFLPLSFYLNQSTQPSIYLSIYPSIYLLPLQIDNQVQNCKNWERQIQGINLSWANQDCSKIFKFDFPFENVAGNGSRLQKNKN